MCNSQTGMEHCGAGVAHDAFKVSPFTRGTGPEFWSTPKETIDGWNESLSAGSGIGDRGSEAVITWCY